CSHPVLSVSSLSVAAAPARSVSPFTICRQRLRRVSDRAAMVAGLALAWFLYTSILSPAGNDNSELAVDGGTTGSRLPAVQIMRIVKKILGVLALYAPPPFNRTLARMRGVRLLDPSTTWIGVRTLIDNEFPELVTIGANVTIAFDVDIIAHIDPPATMRKYTSKAQRPVEIKSNVFIGARALVLPGVTIHEWALVAAGAVVTRDVPKYAIVAGNPARQIGDIRDKATATLEREAILSQS